MIFSEATVIGRATARPRTTVIVATGGSSGSAVESTNVATASRSRTRSDSGVGAKQSHARTVLGASQGNHVSAYMGSDNLTAVSIGTAQDVLDQIVAKLVASNCNMSVSLSDDKR